MEKTLHSIKRKYFTALIIFIVFVVTSLLFLENIHNSEKNLGEIIDKSGKQRMLSQRISLYASTYLKSQNKLILLEYTNVLNEFKNSHNSIYREINDKKIKEFYDNKPNLNDLVNTYVDLNQEFLKNSNEENYRKIFEYQTELLSFLDKAVKLHEENLRNKNDSFDDIIFFILAIFLLLFLIESKYIHLQCLKSLKKVSIHSKMKKKNSKLF